MALKTVIEDKGDTFDDDEMDDHDLAYTFFYAKDKFLFPSL